MSKPILSGIEPQTQAFLQELAAQGSPPIYQRSIADAAACSPQPGPAT